MESEVFVFRAYFLISRTNNIKKLADIVKWRKISDKKVDLCFQCLLVISSLNSFKSIEVIA
jgi:hypothetical protein